jgi:hypothetical protein
MEVSSFHQLLETHLPNVSNKIKDSFELHGMAIKLENVGFVSHGC